MNALTETAPAAPDLGTEASRKVLAKALVALFDHWQLSQDQMLALLGMAPTSKSVLPAYRRGERPLPASRDVADRASFLLRIHKGVRMLYPRDSELRYGWVHRPKESLEGKSPLEIMLKDGLVGVARMARFVDFLRGQ